MLDETSLARLTEMGIDVYLPRRRADATASAAAETARASAAMVAPPASAAQADIVLIARAGAPKPAALIADVARALRFARIACTTCEEPAEAALQSARALVLFGDAPVRAAGALLPAQRQREMGWIVTGEASALAGDARAKRALWSELRRIVRGLGSGGER